jgi:hypothetical protein
MLKKEKTKIKIKAQTKAEPKLKSKSKKEESYFLVLLKKRDLLSASWKIDAPLWKKRIKTAESDSQNTPCLFIDILSFENEKYNKIDSIPVHGLENSWHIFVKNEYGGKRLIFNLSYCDKKGNYYDILISKEIYIPLSSENLEAIHMNPNLNLNEEKILFELSGIDLAGTAGSENTSW